MSVSLRCHLDSLIKKNRLTRIKRQVSCDYELGALLKYFDGKMPMLFEDINGYDITAIGGICGSRDDIGGFLNVDKKDLLPTILDAMSKPIKTSYTNMASCQEIVIRHNIDLKKILPIPKFHEKDAGYFITAGIVVIRDPDSNRYHTSIRRLQFQGGNKLSVLIESPGLMDMYKEYESRNQPLEIAVLLGVHPVITLTSQLNTQLYGLDKFEVAGALMNEPIEMIKCKTVDLEVPASTEIVLEGKMIPNKRLAEGPFGELAGYYGPKTDQPYAEITAVTHRANPIFEVIFPSSDEHKLPNALMRELTLFLHIKHLVPSVTRVHIPTSSGGRFHAIIAIDKKHEGEGKSAIMAALAANKDYKMIVVVDDDVNIFDSKDVDWAIATRFQADLDLVVIPPSRGCPLEPSNNIRGVSGKMGLDATYPLSHKRDFERTRIPGFDSIKVEDYIGGVK